MNFLQPNSLADALQWKSQHGDDARFLAGGTDLVVLRNRGLVRGRVWIDLSQVGELRTLQTTDEALQIGAMCPHAWLEESPLTALAEAAASIGGPQIRNRGTVGGNVGNASPAGDLSVALLAHDAHVTLRSLRGVRTLPLTEFFLAPGKTALAPDEMITQFQLSNRLRSAWHKVGKRDATAISVVAAAVSQGPAGEVRVALGSVAPRPLRVTPVEAMLSRDGLTPDSARAAGDMVRELIQPISDHRASADYRRDVAGTIVSRLLHQLLDPPVRS
ncbi:MAG: xanthine dehydrogenase family protein subunit M [Candidatus Sericytochromatia bacterium]|nr:xanthine dehydrogenase family protein subunit M [Candidatus Sericytochromatia bacterium]